MLRVTSLKFKTSLTNCSCQFACAIDWPVAGGVWRGYPFVAQVRQTHIGACMGVELKTTITEAVERF